MKRLTRVRDLSRYPFDCDGVLVCTDCFTWAIDKNQRQITHSLFARTSKHKDKTYTHYPYHTHYRKQRLSYDWAVRFPSGAIKFYGPLTKALLTPICPERTNTISYQVIDGVLIQHVATENGLVIKRSDNS